MSIPKNDSEEKQLEELRASTEKRVNELRPLAEERDREAKLASKARGRTNQARPKRREVPEKDLRDLGGKKAGRDIIFGPEGQTQLVFSPPRRKVEGATRWAVGLLPVPISRYDTQRELAGHGRGLWDKEKDEPSLAFKAAEQLRIEIERQFRRTLLLLLLRRLREKAKQDGEAAEDTPFTYRQPEIDKPREQLAVVEEQLDTVSEQLATAQDAIFLTVEALSKGLERKLKKAFDLLEGDQWPQDIEKLRGCAMLLAGELQRPPTKAELRKRYNPTLEESRFSPLLQHAGLSWLEQSRRAPA